jgi:FkbM family methyltransferase
LNLGGRLRAHSAARLRRAFYDIVAAERPVAFIEVGAFEASASLEVRTRLPDARIVAFEANPKNHARLSREVDFAAKRVEYLNLAVSDREGALEFDLGATGADGISKKGSVLRRTSAASVQLVLVPSVSLDAFFREAMPASCALWIDVEGASRQVLAGAGEILARSRAVMIEVEDREFWAGQWLAQDVDRFLRAAGFRLIARDHEYRHQHNAIYTRG